MAKFKHLSKSKMDHVIDRVGEVRSALGGLASLFHSQDMSYSPNPNELYGIGDLITTQARALASLDDILRTGYDSKAITNDCKKKELKNVN